MQNEISNTPDNDGTLTIQSTSAVVPQCQYKDCCSVRAVVIPVSVQRILSYAFAGCTALTRVDAPESLRRIGKYAFAGCTSLLRFDVPNSVTKIGRGAFKGCTALRSVAIPNCAVVADGCFAGCDALDDIAIVDGAPSAGARRGSPRSPPLLNSMIFPSVYIPQSALQFT